MTFDHAKNTEIRFGEYKGKTILDISETDKGLRYLDWLVDQPWIKDHFLLNEALNEYLSDPAVKKEVEVAIATRNMK